STVESLMPCILPPRPGGRQTRPGVRPGSRSLGIMAVNLIPNQVEQRRIRKSIPGKAVRSSSGRCGKARGLKAARRAGASRGPCRGRPAKMRRSAGDGLPGRGGRLAAWGCGEGTTFPARVRVVGPRVAAVQPRIRCGNFEPDLAAIEPEANAESG